MPDETPDSRTAQGQAPRGPGGVRAGGGEVSAEAHEDLRVYEAELEMQNEELRDSRARLERSRREYFELFDMAPVGYLSVSERGVIRNANWMAASLLGVDRSRLGGRPFSMFLERTSKQVFLRASRRAACAAGACALRGRAVARGRRGPPGGVS